MNISMEWILQILNVNNMAIRDGKQVESVDITFEPNIQHDVELPTCGWNQMMFNYEPIGTVHHRRIRDALDGTIQEKIRDTLCSNTEEDSDDECEGCRCFDVTGIVADCINCRRAYKINSTDRNKYEDLYLE